MMTETCPRAWEAEASRDGRLSPGAGASFEQHCTSCAPCRRASERLDALAEQLRATTPIADEVASRRLRQRLLRSAHELTTGQVTAQPQRWRLGATGAAALALGLLCYALWPEHSAQPDAEFGVRAEPGAIWSRRRTEGMDELTLLDGSLSVEVRHPRLQEPAVLPARIIVRVPDGQLRDLGTRFRVVVRRERTQEIVVSEGAVLLQRPGLPDVQVEHGATWRLAETLVMASAEPTDAGALSASAAQQPEPALPARTARPRRHGARVVAPASAARDTLGEISSQAEDAAYLHWVSLLRAGRRDAARAAGLDYLRRFPSGFRRAEVQAVVVPLEATPSPPRAPAQQ